MSSSARVLPLRGWMLDAARLVERRSHYEHTIEVCADWGLNALLFRLTDDLFSALYAHALPRRGCSQAWKGPFLPVLWSSDEELKAALANPLPAAPPFTWMRAQALECAPSVRRNLPDFRALELSLRYQEQLCWRINVLMAARERLRAEAAFAANTLAGIAERDAELLAALRRDWVTRRHDVEAGGAGPTHLATADHILLDLQRAAAYSRDLAASPDRLRPLLG